MISPEFSCEEGNETLYRYIIERGAENVNESVQMR
jgi:hypothetical protein